MNNHLASNSFIKDGSNKENEKVHFTNKQNK